MQERLYGTGLGTGSGEHNALGRVAAIEGKQLARDRLVMALFFLTDAVVIGVLAPTRAILIAMKFLASGALGSQARQLHRVVRGDLEEAGTLAIQHDGNQPTELVLYRSQLA